MKNVFKKATVLGAAVLVTLGMNSSMIRAAAPTGESVGILYGDVSIGKGVLDWSPELTLATGLVYTGSAQQLITALNNEVPTGTTLYLRVADSGGAPTSASDWVAYSNGESLTNSVLKRTGAGTYHVYWYLDGGANYNDTSMVVEGGGGEPVNGDPLLDD